MQGKHLTGRGGEETQGNIRVLVLVVMFIPQCREGKKNEPASPEKERGKRGVYIMAARAWTRKSRARINRVIIMRNK